jgi:7-cyano-7-deazaguanine reductase
MHDRLFAVEYTGLMPRRPSRSLEIVPNAHPDRDYKISMAVPAFTCLCPPNGQPDFATIRIRYGPGQHLVELKSLELYMWSCRDEGAFHEDVTNRFHDIEPPLKPSDSAKPVRWAQPFPLPRRAKSSAGKGDALWRCSEGRRDRSLVISYARRTAHSGHCCARSCPPTGG